MEREGLRGSVPTAVHTVDLLEEAISAAERAGFTVRSQWLADGLGGACRVGAQRILFINLASSSGEQLAQVIEALRGDELVASAEVSDALRRLLT